ncbi:beta strand repeat-containing protein [Gemmata sp.]|uniref:beta strand repeat-containing protein n=1 Tax=Gemmata sp. TaxID=1914242 RepID=UPI003F6FB009
MFAVAAVVNGSELVISTDAHDSVTISAAAGVLTVSSSTGLVNGNAAVGGVSTATVNLDDFTSINVLSENDFALRFENAEVAGSAAFANEFLNVLANHVDFTSGPLSVNGLAVATAVRGATVTIDQTITSTGDVNISPLGASVEVLAPINAAGRNVTLFAGTAVPADFTVAQDPAGVITAASLSAQGAGGVDLSQAANVVGAIAGRASSGDFTFAGADDLSVGTVSGVAGIATVSGGVLLFVAAGKSITVGEAVTAGGAGKTLALAADAFDLDAANALTADNLVLRTVGSGVNLTLGAAGLTDAELNAISAKNLTVQASGTLTTSGAIALDDDVSEVITLKADAMVLTAGTVDAGTRTVALVPNNPGTQILLGGADASGILGLMNTELGTITAGTLQIGDATSGAITVAGAVAPAAVGTLLLTTGANVVDSNPSGTDITVSNLGVTAGTGVATAADPLETAVSSLTATTTTGGVFVADAGPLSVGATSAPGDIRISASGTLTVAGEVASSAGSVALTATGAGSNVAYGGAGFSNALAGTVTVNAGGAITHAGFGDDIRASAVVLNAAAGIGASGAPLDMSAGSVAATNTTSGDVVIRLNANRGFTATTASAVNTAATGNVTVTRVGGTQLAVTSAAATNGSVTLGTNGASLSLTGVGAGGANHDVTASTTGSGNIAVGSVAATRLVGLTAGGAITDDGSTATAVTAPSLALAAATGVGTSAAPVNTDVDKVEATTGTGGVFVSNAGAVTIGGVDGTLTGVRVTGASGDIDVTATGTITVNQGVQAPGDVALTATGGTSDIVTQGGNGNAVASSGGTATLRAGRHLTLGTSSAWGDVSGEGLVLEAGGDIVLDNTTFAEANGAAGLRVTAGGDVKILHAIRGGSILNSNSPGANVTITTGPGKSFILDQGRDGGVGASTDGDITINSDNMVLTSGRVGTTGTVTLAPVTSFRAINLGTDVTDALALTDAELDLVAAGTLVIGSAGVPRITVSADLSRPTATKLELVAPSIIQNSDGGSINTAGGALSLRSNGLKTYAPGRTGPDVTASGLSFDSGRDLYFTLGGTTADTEYTRLTVAGTVNLAGTGLVLVFPGSIVPSTGDVFTIVSATSRTGVFNGYGENSTVPFRGVTLRVNYTDTTVTLTAIGAPTAAAQSLTLGQDSAGVPVTLTGTDPNTPALPLTYAVTDPPDHGTLSGTAPNMVYTPDPGYSGPDAFTFATSNGFLNSSEATVSLTVAPPPAVASAAATVTNASPIPVTVTFSESVTGFEATDVVVGNGTVTNFAGSGATYTFGVVPAGQGAVTVDVGAGAGQYASGFGTPAAARLTRTFDGLGPVVAISAPVVVGPGVVAYTVTYTDDRFAASDLGTGDITLNTTGSVTGTVSVDTGTGKIRTVTVSGITGVGNLSISLAPGTAEDTLGNPALAASSETFGARRRFDMKANSIGKQSAGWERVMPGTKYSAALGYGWATTGSVGGSTGGRVPAGGDARVLGDYAYGLTPVAFKVFVGAGQSATVTVHTYSAPTQGLQGVRASIVGGTTQTLRGSGTVTVSGTAGADGVLTVTFSTAPGSSLWIVNAVEVTPGLPV